MTTESSYVLYFEEVGSESVSKVGGKNASLGEMIARLKTEGIRVPGGFATTAEAYRVFLEAGNLREKLGKQLADLERGTKSLEQAGKSIRRLFLKTSFPEGISKAAGIVTDHGGRTCHAAIVSRELGIPAVVGTGEATDVLETAQEITISCAEGDEGYIYEGILKFEEREVDLRDIPEIPFFSKIKKEERLNETDQFRLRARTADPVPVYVRWG